MANLFRLVLFALFLVPAFSAFADQLAYVKYAVTGMGSDYSSLSAACSAAVSYENSTFYQYQSNFSLVYTAEPNICNATYVYSVDHLTYPVQLGVYKTFYCPVGTDVMSTFQGHAATCSGNPPPVCPVDNGYVAGGGCKPTAACANSCTYALTGSQHCSYSVLGISFCVYDGYKSGAGTPGCAAPFPCADGVPPDKPPDNTKPPLNVDLPPLSPKEKADVAAAAAAAAASAAAASAAAAAANPSPDTSAASAAAAAAADSARAHADALGAAADASAANNLATTTRKQAAADSQAAADAVQKAAADAANPQATPAEIAVSMAAAQAAIARAAASGLIQGNASNSSAAATANANAKAAADAATAAKNAAAAAGAADGGSAAGQTAAAISAALKANPAPDFCELHPKSSICLNSSIGNGTCQNGVFSGFSCSGDAIQCAIAQQQQAQRCADLSTDSTSDLGAKVMDGTAALGGTDTFATPKEVGIGNIDNTSFLSKGCLADLNFTIVGQNIVLPLSRLCEGLQTAGKIVLAFAYMLAARIIFM